MKSEDERMNAAAYIFAKWLTEKEQNLNFVTQSGYLPVTDAAFDSLFADITIVKNERYHSLYQAVDTMRKDYIFYAQPLYKGASDIQLGFETNVKEVLLSAHNQYGLRVAAGEDPDVVLEELVRSSLDELRKLSGL
jgi:multiple sugar transport system substrate-binding protein